MILITSTSEILLYFTVILFLVSFHKKKKKNVVAGLFFFFFMLSCVPYLYSKIACPVGLNCDQMEHLEEEQYNQYPVERNRRAHMSMREYRNLPWQNQQPLGRNPNRYRSMRDYRNQWMSAPLCSVPLTNAPSSSPYYSSTPQPPQPPQLTSSVEQAILNLSKLVDNFKEEQMAVNV